MMDVTVHSCNSPKMGPMGQIRKMGRWYYSTGSGPNIVDGELL
jgi:hypothetical protein